MESEKVKEIKKALECCKDRLCEVCTRLKQEPNQEEDCRLALIGQSLTLINELERENERLLNQRNKTFNIWVKDTEKLKDRIAELENGDYYKKLEKKKEDLLCKEYKLIKYENEIKATALKQFAEKLKAKMPCEEVFKGIWDKIDETLKEFI